MNNCSYIHIPDWCCDHRLDETAELFKCLADPTRLKLLTIMAACERTVGDLACGAGASASAVSHQLRLLRTLRLVRSRREGRRIYYSLADNHIDEILKIAITHISESPKKRSGKKKG